MTTPDMMIPQCAVRYPLSKVIANELIELDSEEDAIKIEYDHKEDTQKNGPKVT